MAAYGKKRGLFQQITQVYSLELRGLVSRTKKLSGIREGCSQWQ